MRMSDWSSDVCSSDLVDRRQDHRDVEFLAGTCAGNQQPRAVIAIAVQPEVVERLVDSRCLAAIALCDLVLIARDEPVRARFQRSSTDTQRVVMLALLFFLDIEDRKSTRLNSSH